MNSQLTTFDATYSWLSELKNKSGKPATPNLLLGNGFSIAFDYRSFSYSALRSEAQRRGLIGAIASKMFNAFSTQDFELVIKALQDAVQALKVLDSDKYKAEIDQMEMEISDLKEALAQVLAGLHPDRPYEIEKEAYIRVRKFLDSFGRIYTANYDLLLYWSLMQDFSNEKLAPRRTDDGFRDPGYEAEYVLWDYLNPHTQNVYYIHGALHLFLGDDGLRKLTWNRTDDPLIDQIRKQLAVDSFPLYVAEGTSKEKLRRIQHSDNLSRSLRSLASLETGGLLAYGLSFSPNDDHIINAIAKSKTRRIAVSIYGEAEDPSNQAILKAVAALQRRRVGIHENRPLDVQFFDATSVKLWS